MNGVIWFIDLEKGTAKEEEFLRMFTFKFGQLSAIASRETSVTKVPPTFRFCKELALEIWEHNRMHKC